MGQKSTDFQVLNDFFTRRITEEELTAHQKKRLVRIRHCYRMLNEMRSSIDIISSLNVEHGIHDATAWRDLSLTEKIFGGLRENNKSMKRGIAEKMALDAYRIAAEAKSVKDMVAAGKLYVDATGCAIEDPDMPEFDKLQPNVYVMVLPPEAEKVMGQLLATPGPVNLSKIYNDAEEVEFTESEAGDRGEDRQTASDGE